MTNRILLGSPPSYEAEVFGTMIDPNAGTAYANLVVRFFLRNVDNTGYTYPQMKRWMAGHKVRVHLPSGAYADRDILDVHHGNKYIDINIYTPNFVGFGEQLVAVPGFEDLPHVPYGVPIGDNGPKIELLSPVSHALSVSVPGVDTLDPSVAHSGNLIFDTSDFVENALFAVQTGSFVLAGYKHRHDPVFHAGNRTNVSISIAETKSVGKELDIPLVMMQFAVCNSTGHFHPNYADASNSQILAYMDSIWVKQLNVIGGTINTESQLEISEQNVAPDDGPYNYGDTITDLSYGGDARDSDTIRKNRWNKIHAAAGEPSGGVAWEPLMRPDNTHLYSDHAIDSAGAKKPHTQTLPPYSMYSNSSPHAGAEEQYYPNYTGRNGYWKQKTWGLIYYVDHKKIIVQAFNDKSTSNAMNTGTSTMHRDAWLAEEGDLGRVIATTNTNLDLDWSSGHKTGGAFNHNLAHEDFPGKAQPLMDSHYDDGVGFPIFDYYKCPPRSTSESRSLAHDKWKHPDGADFNQQGGGKGDDPGLGTNNPRNPCKDHRGYFGWPAYPDSLPPSHAEHQEHMPRPYLGGWDNFLWDNVPLHGTMDEVATVRADPDPDVKVEHNVQSPWMYLSDSISGYGSAAGRDVGPPLYEGGYGKPGSMHINTFSARSTDPTFQHVLEKRLTEGIGGATISGDVGAQNWAVWYTNQDLGGGFDSWGHSGEAGGGRYFAGSYDKPWISPADQTLVSGTLSYRESIAPNTEVTTVLTNHFNPLADPDGGEALDKNGNPYGWDYFFITYVVFNQGTGGKFLEETPNQDNRNPYSDSKLGPAYTDESNVETRKNNFPIEPWTGQPLHD